MLLHYSDGRVLFGVLVSLCGNQIRVALKDMDDIAEFKLLSGVWISEHYEAVEFEFLGLTFRGIEMGPNLGSFDFFVNFQPAAKATYFVN